VDLFRPTRLLFTELKQSQWLALGAPFAILASYGLFLALILSPDPEVSSRALYTLEEMSVVLPPLGATLWGYLCVGSVFDQGRDVLHVRDRHFLTKAVIRAGVPLLLLVAICSGMTALLIPEFSAEIMLLAPQVMSSCMLCVVMVAFASYVFSAAFIGLTASLMFVLTSYGMYLGWFAPFPLWPIPGGGADPLNTALVIAVAALLLQLVLFVCETKQARF